MERSQSVLGNATKSLSTHHLVVWCWLSVVGLPDWIPLTIEVEVCVGLGEIRLSVHVTLSLHGFHACCGTPVPWLRNTTLNEYRTSDEESYLMVERREFRLGDYRTRKKCQMRKKR